MHRAAAGSLEPLLDAQIAVPHHALEGRIDEADDHRRGQQLRIEARALGDAAGDDGRNRRGESEQEEELDEFVAVALGQRLGAGEEVHAVGDAVADEEVGQRRDREVDQDLDQRVDLVLLAHRAELEEGESGVHGEHHDRAEQDEEGIAAVLEWLHER